MSALDFDLSGSRRAAYLAQNEASGCALACLAMVAIHQGYQADLCALRQRHSLSLKGATLRQVKKSAEAISCNARPLRGETNDLPILCERRAG